MSFNVTVKGINGLIRKLNSAEKGLNNFSKPLKLSDRYMNSEIQKNFSTEGSTLSDGWAQLSPSTLRQKKGNNILVESGKMKKSFKSQLTSMKLTISNPTKYFKYHQSNRPRKKLPRRVMLGIKKEQATIINKFFSKYIKSLFR